MLFIIILKLYCKNQEQAGKAAEDCFHRHLQEF